MLGLLKELYLELVPWPPSRYNFTLLGYVVLWVPWLIISHWGFLLTIGLMVFAGPFIWLADIGEKLDKKYDISQKMDGLNCRVAKKLALIRSCDSE